METTGGFKTQPSEILHRILIMGKKTLRIHVYWSGQISIIPKPEFFGDFGDTSLPKAPFKVTSGRYNLPRLVYVPTNFP